MLQHKPVKIYLCFAVLLLVAKPFLGFSLFDRMHPPAKASIFLKAFTKRKQEYAKDSKFDIIAIQKKLADPAGSIFLRFTFLLSILFPLVFGIGTINLFLRRAKPYMPGNHQTYLLNSQLII